MLGYIYEALEGFREVFSRDKTWLIFVMLVLGFIGSTEVIGVSSFCRFWLLDACGYDSLLRFFRSDAWSLNQLTHHWNRFALAQNETIQLDGRTAILGDHTYVPKDGRRMPGVVTLHQNSETQSKPSYFRGQCWGAIGLLVGSRLSAFCLPLSLRIHQGLKHIKGESDTTDTNKTTLAERVVIMAMDFSLQNGIPCVLGLDAYFSVASVFRMANTVWSVKLKAPLVTIVVRAKKNYVAYFPPEEVDKKKLGRPKKYGEKITLMECFDHLEMFSKVQCLVYGKQEEIYLTHHDLLWKGTGEMIRFVFALTSLGPIVLMCSDLNQKPVLALELYCSRIRIEIMFDVLKNLIKAFRFRFWSKKMPLHSRRPRRNKDTENPVQEGIKAVILCWEASEVFVMIGAIAQGMLQMLSLKYHKQVWKKSWAFIRTKSRELPSEKTVKQLIAPLIGYNFINPASNLIMRKIHKRFSGEISPKMILEEQLTEKEAA